MSTYVHPAAIVSEDADLDEDVKIWAFTQVREGARVGSASSVGSHSYIDFDVEIGANCKIQSGALLFHGSVLGDGVFVGPGAIVTNDLRPRAINPDGSPKALDDWVVGGVTIGRGAALGAGSIVIAGVDVGEFAMLGAGAMAARDVPPHALVVGVPGRVVGWVCCCGEKLNETNGQGECPKCGAKHTISSL